ncbi:unnamed protein product [Acanthoscelides obtectus]|uniref:Uncharacterized protein n=1 Tax=Acanthoscelides obtectus TaxID=200917 RepID=A0A9P0KVZ9_ACAOB|nr:unnamed protein product [Acanthoscelides obtectus]CAK1651219.1 hypothetical protein AOBTE_LOCUS17122 [Acanthoscelides obtectus]
MKKLAFQSLNQSSARRGNFFLCRELILYCSLYGRSVIEKCALSIIKTLTSFREISEVIRILRLVQVYVRR